MVNLYTNKKYISSDIITDNEAFFDRYVAARNIDANGRAYLKQIDGAEIIDDELGTITTPLGATILENISTGAKTALNLYYLQHSNTPMAIDITECGANALDVIFALMDDYDGDVKILLCHADTSKCGDRDYRIDGEHIASDAVELSIALMERLGVRA